MTKESIAYDIETTGLEPINSIVTCICAKTSDGRIFVEAGNPERGMIERFVLWLKNFTPNKYFILSKNGKKFDHPFLITRILLLNLDKTYVDTLTKFDHIDLQDITTKWMSLQNMAEILCLGGKLGKGKDAIELFQTNDLEGLAKYCLRDVILTEVIYQVRERLKIDHDGIVEKRQELVGEWEIGPTEIPCTE